MNREKANTLIRAELARVSSKALNDEIEHFLSIDDDEDRPHDYYDAIDQAYDLAIDVNDRKVIVPARRVLIAIGVYRIITEDEIANTVTLGRGKKYDFQHEGAKYVFENHLRY